MSPTWTPCSAYVVVSGQRQDHVAAELGPLLCAAATAAGCGRGKPTRMPLCDRQKKSMYARPRVELVELSGNALRTWVRVIPSRAGPSVSAVEPAARRPDSRAASSGRPGRSAASGPEISGSSTLDG